MKAALIIGSGSIALRHAGILSNEGFSISYVSSRSDLNAEVFASISHAVATRPFDYVVIANETSQHDNSMQALRKFSGKIMIEKPLATSATTLNEFNPGQVSVAFNLRFHPAITWLKRQIKGHKVLSVQCYVGQDLATWRPGRLISEQYSAHKARGGGVLRDLSHELDYLTWLFGPWQSVAAIGGRLAQVTVDSDDSWAIIGEFVGARQVSLQLNYLDKEARRFVIVNTESETFTVDLVNFTVAVGKTKEVLDATGADSYLAMHRAVLLGDTETACSTEQALETDKLILAIEKAAREQTWVKR